MTKEVGVSRRVRRMRALHRSHSCCPAKQCRYGRCSALATRTCYHGSRYVEVEERPCPCKGGKHEHHCSHPCCELATMVADLNPRDLPEAGHAPRRQHGDYFLNSQPPPSTCRGTWQSCRVHSGSASKKGCRIRLDQAGLPGWQARPDQSEVATAAYIRRS